MKTDFAFHKPVPRQVHTPPSPRRKNLPAAFFIGLYLLCPLASMAHDAHPPGTVVGLGSQVFPQVEPSAGEPKLWIRQRIDLLSHGIVEPLGMAAGAEGDVFVLGHLTASEYGVVRILSDGRIDPSFAQGRTRILLNTSEQPPRLRSSGSGGFLVMPQTEGVLRRYLPNGSVDPSYADGLGVRIGPGSEFFWQEDGTVLIDSHENRVLVSETGHILFDTETVLRTFIQFAHRYPNGRVLLWRDGEIVWLLTDGQPDPNPSPAFEGAIREVRRDESGYVYLLFFDHEVPTVDGAPVSNLIRLNPDGSFDAEFQHGLTLAVSLNLQLDGSVVVLGNKGEEYGAWQVASGELIPLLKPIFVPWPTSWRDSSAPLGGGGWVAASYSWRGGRSSLCHFHAYQYTAGGPVRLQGTSRECWLWPGRIGVSTHGQDAWILSPDSLSRYSFVSSNDSFPAGRALVGFSESGRLQRSGPISFSVERAGDLSVPMVVTWSIAQVGLGGRPEGKARLRSISFQPFATTSPIELSEDDLSGMGSVREFELRLEEAEGADISTARVMRLLVFDPPGPAAAQASLSLVPIPTRAAEALALLHVSGAGEYWLERSDNLEDWRRYFAEPVRLPFTSISLLGPEGAGFYRLKRR